MDFGIARVRGAEHMTSDGCAVGTPAYMAPEQVLGEEVDGRADVYAVGLILYRLLAGRLPFDADTPMAMWQKQVSETPPPLSTYRQDLPAWCDIVVQRALAKAPDDRFQTAEEFRAAVGRAADVTERQVVETLPISRSEAGLPPLTASPHAWSILERAPALKVVPANLRAILLRTKALVATRQGAAILAGFCAAGVLVYLNDGASATDAETARPGETRAVERTPPPIDPRESETAATRPVQGHSCFERNWFSQREESGEKKTLDCRSHASGSA
jgi:hypothetical protein